MYVCSVSQNTTFSPKYIVEMKYKNVENGHPSRRYLLPFDIWNAKISNA